MNRVTVLAIVPLLVAGPLSGQGTRLDGKLDPQVAKEIGAFISAAAADSIPARALEDKALEGAAKKVPAPVVLEAVKRLAGTLREARGALRSGQPAGALPDAEIIAAADAHQRGVAVSDISALRQDVPPGDPLVVPLTVLGDLVQRGVPAEKARTVISALLKRGSSAEQIAQLPGRVDVAMRVGASPAKALEGAAGQPAGGPPAGVPGNGKGNGNDHGAGNNAGGNGNRPITKGRPTSK